MKDLNQGLNVWITGWKAIFSHRSLLVTAMVPFLISLLSAAVSIWSFWIYYPVWIVKLTPEWLSSLTGIWSYLVYPYQLAVSAAVVLGSLYLIYVLQAVIAIPFYSSLAAKSLQLSGKAIGNQDWRTWIRMLKVSLVKGALLLFLGFWLFVFSFVPVLNVVAVIATLLILAFDCMDYSLEILQMGLRQRVGYAFSHKRQWVGMAGGLALTLLIPGLTLLVIPGAVAGAAFILKANNDSRNASPKNL